MKEPDKIYVSIGYEAQTKPFYHSIEYIRKDALLEWAKEQASTAEKLNGKGAMLKVWNTLIDKLNSI